MADDEAVGATDCDSVEEAERLLVAMAEADKDVLTVTEEDALALTEAVKLADSLTLAEGELLGVTEGVAVIVAEGSGTPPSGGAYIHSASSVPLAATNNTNPSSLTVKYAGSLLAHGPGEMSSSSVGTPALPAATSLSSVILTRTRGSRP